jgi:hypothetical protein
MFEVSFASILTCSVVFGYPYILVPDPIALIDIFCWSGTKILVPPLLSKHFEKMALAEVLQIVACTYCTSSYVVQSFPILGTLLIPTK